MRAITSKMMAVVVSGWVIAAVPARAQEVDESEPTDQELVQRVARTSILWIAPSYLKDNQHDLDTRKIAALFSKAVEDQTSTKDIKTEAIYDALGGFALPVSPDVAQSVLAELAKLKPLEKPETQEEIDIQILKEISAVLAVDADLIVSLAGEDCSDDEAKPLADLPAADRPLPIGVKRVGGKTTAPTGGYKQKIWIIDSGLDNKSKYINANDTSTSLAANCHVQVNKAWVCATAGEAGFNNTFVDMIGHGTMLAGIIGAKPPATPTPPAPLHGVAPGVEVVPVKIFKKKTRVSLAGPVLSAINYVASKASSGDIINMSWGAAWLERMHKKNNQLKTVMGYPAEDGNAAAPGLAGALRDMASSRNLKIVIAAGNIDPEVRPSWVHFVAPAALGSYPKPGVGEADAGDGCRICTISAVKSEQLGGGAWKDTFWWDTPGGVNEDPEASGNFGSNYGRNPPDFAEPGVDVWSLWPPEPGGTKNRINQCSGSSFAAAHFSGILVRMIQTSGTTVDPVIGGHAEGDPDTPPPAPGTADLRDPVGIANK